MWWFGHIHARGGAVHAQGRVVHRVRGGCPPLCPRVLGGYPGVIHSDRIVQVFGLSVVDAPVPEAEHVATNSNGQAIMRDQRTEGSVSTGDPGSGGRSVDARPVRLQAVRPTISAPVLHDPPPALEGPELSTAGQVRVLEIEVPWAALPRSPLRRSDLEVAASVAATVSLVAVDVLVGLASGVLVCGIAALLRVDRRIPFSFGEGFIGYRGDPAWPRGVREDDDFRWNWKPRPS
jgi:hypothetical protein